MQEARNARILADARADARSEREGLLSLHRSDRRSRAAARAARRCQAALGRNEDLRRDIHALARGKGGSPDRSVGRLAAAKEAYVARIQALYPAWSRKVTKANMERLSALNSGSDFIFIFFPLLLIPFSFAFSCLGLPVCLPACLPVRPFDWLSRSDEWHRLLRWIGLVRFQTGVDPFPPCRSQTEATADRPAWQRSRYPTNAEARRRKRWGASWQCESR